MKRKSRIKQFHFAPCNNTDWEGQFVAGLLLWVGIGFLCIFFDWVFNWKLYIVGFGVYVIIAPLIVLGLVACDFGNVRDNARIKMKEINKNLKKFDE
jgi:hypothetical protein